MEGLGLEPSIQHSPGAQQNPSTILGLHLLCSPGSLAEVLSSSGWQVSSVKFVCLNNMQIPSLGFYAAASLASLQPLSPPSQCRRCFCLGEVPVGWVERAPLDVDTSPQWAADLEGCSWTQVLGSGLGCKQEGG